MLLKYEVLNLMLVRKISRVVSVMFSVCFINIINYGFLEEECVRIYKFFGS